MSASASSTALAFRHVDAASWADFERLFESRGGPKNCWCMVWRSTAAESKQANAKTRRAAIKQRVDGGTQIGLIAYAAGEPVAWCSIAPRTTYLRLGGMEDACEENVWSLACLFVTRRLRGQGITQRLIAAAVEYARDHGATILEAYPVDPDSPSYRFMGFVATFEAAGFETVGRAGTRRHVMRLRIG